MIIKKKDNIEEWTAKNMLYYVVNKLNEKGNDYRPNFPRDMMIAGSVFKNCKNAGKSNAFIRNRIDEKLDGCDVKSVKSLQFLLMFFQDVPFHFRRNYRMKTDAVNVPHRAVKALRQLKKELAN